MTRTLRQYLETALWSSTDLETDVPLDASYTVNDVSAECAEESRRDLESFLETNADDIGSRTEDAAHDFWLTRNRHGAGFWDGDWADAAGKRLTESAKAYGEVTLVIGDDGMIHAN
jgi:hypothetical protein